MCTTLTNKLNVYIVAREHLNILSILTNCKRFNLMYFMPKVTTSLPSVDILHLNIGRYLMKVKARKRISLQYC